MTTTYTGGCHCGALAFEFENEGDITAAMSCNCSHCSMKGFHLAFVPRDKFRLTKGGESDWTTYHFNKGSIDHNFCKTCGVESFAFGVMPDGAKIAAVNLNCVDALELDTLQIRKVDGKSF